MADPNKPQRKEKGPKTGDYGSAPSTAESSTQPSLDGRESDYIEPVEFALAKHVNIVVDKSYEGNLPATLSSKFAGSKISSEDLLAKILASRKASRIMQSMNFRLNWDEFVRTVKVHEMLKCLEAEHRKLKILRQHAEDVLVQQASREKDNKMAQKKFRKRESRDSIGEADLDESIGDEGLDNIETENEKRKRKKAQRDASADRGGKAATRTASHASTISDLSTEKEKVEKVTRSKNITDEEFEEIVALCPDKIEQRALRETFAEKRQRDKYLHNASERRRMTYDFINGRFFKNFMLVTIIISTTGITLLTFEAISIHYLFPIMMLDACVMGVFVVEAYLKISIYREDYFKRLWNLLDMIIVIVHLSEITVDLVTKTLALSYDINALIYFKFLKSLRALRLLRVIKFLPNLQVIVSTIFQSFLSLGSIAVLMCLFIFVFAVMGKGLFSEDSPQEFGTLWNAIVTLFQLLTLDDWSTLLKEIENKGLTDQYWMMFFYLFLYILIEYFVFLNLFVAVLVDNFQLSLAEAEVRQKKDALKYEASKIKLEIEEPEKDNAEEKVIFVQGSDMNNEAKTEEKVADEPTEKPLLNTDVVPEATYELPVEDYYGTPKGSRESVFIENSLKNMTAIDFQRLIWRRRITVLNNILDEATLTRADAYLKAKKQEDEEATVDHDDYYSDDEEEDVYLQEEKAARRQIARSVTQLGIR